MIEITFFKYQGTGNDFVILDDRSNALPHLSKTEIRKICDRRFGVGADGLMILKTKPGFDFEMIYFNADGGEGSMCGNGGRSIVKYFVDHIQNKPLVKFIAVDGDHIAEIDNGIVKLKMNSVTQVEKTHGEYILNTGSPHYVVPSSDVATTNVVEDGRRIRHSKRFAAEGINVNFVEAMDESGIFVRTYERGVEDETLSCGTGATAAALVFAHNNRGFNHVHVQTLGGKLYVEFDKQNNEQFDNIWLCGPAEFVFKGSYLLPSE